MGCGELGVPELWVSSVIVKVANSDIRLQSDLSILNFRLLCANVHAKEGVYIRVYLTRDTIISTLDTWAGTSGVTGTTIKSENMLLWGAEVPTTDAILAASVGTSWVYLRSVRASPSMLRMVVKAASTALLSVLSVLNGEPLLLSVALMLGSIGDACLAWDGDTAFLAGLGSFLSAHILYIIIFCRIGHGMALLLGSVWRTVAIAMLICVFIPSMLWQLVPNVARDMRLPVLAYTGVIMLMVLSALSLDKPMVITGALCFTLSDAILSAEKFLVATASAHRRWMPYAVWVLYYAGQLQITLGLLG